MANMPAQRLLPGTCCLLSRARVCTRLRSTDAAWARRLHTAELFQRRPEGLHRPARGVVAATAGEAPRQSYSVSNLI